MQFNRNLTDTHSLTQTQELEETIENFSFHKTSAELKNKIKPSIGNFKGKEVYNFVFPIQET